MFTKRDQNKLKRLLDSPREPAGGPTPPHSTPPKRNRSQELAHKSRQRLASARFRALNEFLYSHSSSEANSYLSSERFHTYHKTYDEIAKKWPTRPIDVIIKRLKSRQSGVIADIGCGSRPLIKEALPALTVHSFDLVSAHPDVTATDMTLLPLADQSVDVCVYCLSLMATNLSQCLREANRVLKQDGALVVAEVSSRFDPDHQPFVRQLRALGFELRHSEGVTDFFLLLEFFKRKSLRVGARLPSIALKPCVYKLR